MSRQKGSKERNAVIDGPQNLKNGAGRIHIYEGDGKGKTTAAVGLAVRFAGTGKTALFAQFLKKNNSGELRILQEIREVKLLLCSRNFGFTFQMTPEEKQEAAACYTKYLHDVLEAAKSMASGETEAGDGKTPPGMLLVLDEILAAYNQNMVDRRELLDFLNRKPGNLEVVMTGRNPAPELSTLADYITVMEKKKHPFDDGVPARRGVEW